MGAARLGQGLGIILNNDVPAENVVWMNLVGVSATGNSLTKTGMTTGWNAGAVSTKFLASGDGYVEFTATETTTDTMCGLGNGNASASHTDIEYALYALYAKADGTVQVWEAGTLRGGFGSYAAGDRFRVGVESGVVKYRKNGTVFYTSTVAPAYPLLVDTSLLHHGSDPHQRRDLGALAVISAAQPQAGRVDPAAPSRGAEASLAPARGAVTRRSHPGAIVHA